MGKFKRLIVSLFIILFSISSSIVFAASEDININDVNTKASSCILIDTKTGRILYAKNAYEKMFPASTTKLMTAILTLENCKLDDVATVSHNAVFSIPYGYSHASLREGEELTIEQLLNVLLIPSANDAAVVLAEHIAGSVEDFAVMMNNKAKELGCLDTHFLNPNGVHDDEHVSTAYDLSLIGQYATKFPDIMRIAKLTRYTLPVTNKYSKTDRIFNTTNSLIKDESMNSDYYPYATGLKTGYTDKSGYCIVTTAKKGDQELLAVVLNDDTVDNRTADCKALFEYGFNNYSYTTLEEKNDVVEQIKIDNGTKETKDLNVLVKNDIKVLVKDGDNSENIEPKIEIQEDIKAPIAENAVVGKITYTVNGTSYSSDLIAEHTVYASNFETILFRGLLIFLVLLILFAFLKTTSRPRKKKYSKHSRNRGNGHSTRKSSSRFVELEPDFYYRVGHTKKRRKKY